MSFDLFNNWYDVEAAKKAAAIKDAQDAGMAEGEKGKDKAATNNANILAAAQAVARKLAVNGPVTIDDVIHEMRRLGYRESDIAPGKDAKGAKNWKGSVFADADWVCVGQIVSREKSAHGRNVRQWATKGWLKLHPVNGSMNEAASFHLYKIYQEAAHTYPAGTELCILLGRDMLDSSMQELVLPPTAKYRPDGTVEELSCKTMYGCKVFSFSGIGAICLPRAMLNASLRTADMFNQVTPGEKRDDVVQLA